MGIEEETRRREAEPRTGEHRGHGTGGRMAEVGRGRDPEERKGQSKILRENESEQCKGLSASHADWWVGSRGRGTQVTSPLPPSPGLSNTHHGRVCLIGSRGDGG